MQARRGNWVAQERKAKDLGSGPGELPSVACAGLFGPVVAGPIGWVEVRLRPKLGMGHRPNKKKIGRAHV